ncbi:310_t:CDS:2, partial [Scutellospora calospora]
MTNHILNICGKILAENKVFYSQIIKNKSEQVIEISTYKLVLITDYFDKATISLEKNLYSSYDSLSRYILSNRIIQTEYAWVLVEIIDQIKNLCDLTLSLDGWTD